MKAIWDIKTAKSCRIPEVEPNFCNSCRDVRFCDFHKLNLRQMTIEELKKSGDPK